MPGDQPHSKMRHGKLWIHRIRMGLVCIHGRACLHEKDGQKRMDLGIAPTTIAIVVLDRSQDGRPTV